MMPVPEASPAGAAASRETALRSGRRFEIGVATHAGAVRRVNEDRYFVDRELGVFAVADGMGGHEAGELASTTVVEELASLGAPVSAADLLARLEDRVLRANAKLFSLSEQHGRTMGSTVAALLVFGDDYACVWSGDSRIYRVRAGAITVLSRDHTEVRDLVERGILTAQEAKTWPRRHIITRAIGVGPDPELELEQGRLKPGDSFVICSDGLTAHLSDPEILALVADVQPQAASNALLALTLERGASDNVTVVVVRLGIGNEDFTQLLLAPDCGGDGAPR